MQFTIYRNKGNAHTYPYLLDVQSDIIGELNTRLVIPLVPLAGFPGRPAQRLNPVISVEGGKHLVLTHEMAAVRLGQLGEVVIEVQESRQLIKDAIDFLLDGV
ncbi:CcdB family protein [Aeromonas veronii bv. sobria]|uniref:CcdB family protein n=1 Tax=Aeromonas veronii TaxID=654 RepID=UPI0029459B7C|nr:CcdB family protein [Klebsiella quasipneumoniae subsp. similipneumoniae]